MSSAMVGFEESIPWSMVERDTKAQAVYKQAGGRWASKTNPFKALQPTRREEAPTVEWGPLSNSLKMKTTCGKTSTGTSGIKPGRPLLRIITTSLTPTRTQEKVETSPRIHTRRLTVIWTQQRPSLVRTGSQGLTETITR